MQYSLGCELPYLVTSDTTMILHIEVARIGRQTVIAEQLSVPDGVSLERHLDADSGNRLVRFRLPPGEHTIGYSATVSLDPVMEDPNQIDEVPVGELPLELLTYLNPSRYCLSDELSRFANLEFGEMLPGHSRVAAICNWINDRVAYQRGTSDTFTTSVDTFAMRAGVCRDFAHLGISFCRALGIPARFISSYAYGLQPPDFHAVFEAYLGGRWYLFDPTRQAALDGLVRIGSGRDAADAAFANLYGMIEAQPMRVWMDKLTPDQSIERTVDAVSVVAA